MPRYSVVLPVLNGGETLPLTLQHLLSIPYQNFEVIVSDNHSSDNTASFLSSIQDSRLKVISPPSRLGWSENLAFAYQHASGEWQFHIGDDDVVLPTRFEILDELLEQEPNTDVLWTRHFRYYWPSYNKLDLANVIDTCSFTGLYSVIDPKYLPFLIRGTSVDAGCCLTVHKSLIQRVINRYGFWTTSQHGEAFSHRAALLNAKKVVSLDLPLAIMGRHSKSIATQHLQSKEHYGLKGETDIQHSDPDDFPCTPWKYKGYISWSLSALGTLIQSDNRIPPLTSGEWASWFYATLSEVKSLRNKNQISYSLDSVSTDASLFESFNYDLTSRSTSDCSWSIGDNIIWNMYYDSSNKLIYRGMIDSVCCSSFNVFDISSLAFHLEALFPYFYGTSIDRPQFVSASSVNSPLIPNLEKYIRKFSELDSCQPISSDESSCVPTSVSEVTSFESKSSKFISLLSDYEFVAGPKIYANIVLPFKHESGAKLFKALKFRGRSPELHDKTHDQLLEGLNLLQNSESNNCALVLGNGPSLDMLDRNQVSEFIAEGNHVYRMNHAFDDTNSLPMTHYVSADYKMFSDCDPSHLPRIQKVHKRLEMDNVTVFVPLKMILNPEHNSSFIAPNTKIIFFETDYLERHRGGDWMPNGRRCYWSNTLLFALSLCRFQGYKRVYIAGADCNYHQCITVTPTNDLGMIENHSGLHDRFREGYPMPSSLSDYFANLSFWHWSFGYIADERFVNLDPLSMISAIAKLSLNNMNGSQLLTAPALARVINTIHRYAETRKI